MNQSNRFSPMDIDLVKTTIEDSDETTTHIKTDTIKLQKRLHKKKKKNLRSKEKEKSKTSSKLPYRK